jgi:[acyl-carrier-protein] S-malonyltransferase
MSAVLGGDPDVVAAHLEKLGLTAANNNGGGQIVAAGTTEQLAALAADRPDGARVRPLQVAGAFHTTHMAPAVTAMAEAVADIEPADPGIRYVSNADGEVVQDGKEIVRRLVAQVSSPVRWDLCVETFRRLGVTGLIELCPGGTLTALAKRNLPDVRRVALKTPDNLTAARELVTEHAAVRATAEQAE